MIAPLRMYKKSFAGLSRPVWLLSLVMLINRTGTMVIPFLTIYLTGQLDFTKVEAGLIMSVFGLGSVLGSLAGGYLSDRIGYFKVMFISLFASGFCFYGLMFAKTFEWMALGVFVTSLIAESFRPAAQVAIGAYSKPENRVVSISLLRLAINLGFAFGPFVGGFIAYKIGFNGLFIIDGTTCVLASIFFLIVLSPKKVAVKDKDDDLAGEIGEDRTPLRDKNYLAFLLFTFMTAFVFMQLFSVFPVFLKESWSMDEHHVGLLMGLNGLVIVITEMPLVYYVKNRFRSLNVIAIGAFLIGLSFLILHFTGWLGILLMSTLLVTFGEILFMPFSNTWAINWAPKANTGKYMSWFTMVYSFAHIASPSFGMTIADRFGYSFLWFILGGVSMLSVAGFLLMKRSSKVNKVEQKELALGH